MLDTIIVILAVAAAAAYLLRRFFTKGGGCASCPEGCSCQEATLKPLDAPVRCTSGKCRV